MESYATSHEALDNDEGMQEETRNAARALVQAVKMVRRGEMKQPDPDLREPAAQVTRDKLRAPK